MERERKSEQERKRQEMSAKTVIGKRGKEIREREKAKEKKMRDLFYGRDDVNKYLGLEL